MNKLIKILNLIIIIFVILIINKTPLFAEYELVNTGINYFPLSPLEDPELGTYEEDIRVKVEEFYFNLNLPVEFNYAGNMKTLLNNKFSYELLDFRLHEWPEVSRQYDFRRLHSISYYLKIEQYFNKAFFIKLENGIGIYSDFDEYSDLSKDDVVYKGLAAIGVDVDAGQFYVGAMRTTLTGSIRILPVVGYQNSVTNRIHLDIRVPEYAELWVAEDNFKMGFVIRTKGDHYNITKEESLEKYKIKYSVLTFGPAFKFYPDGKIFVDLSTGWTVGKRRLEIYDRDDKKHATFDLNERWFVRLGVGYRML